MARKKNTSTNPVDFFKPNQFPSSRLGNIQWNAPVVTQDKPNTNTTTDEESSDIEQGNSEQQTPSVPGTKDYYANRFKDS